MQGGSGGGYPNMNSPGMYPDPTMGSNQPPQHHHHQHPASMGGAGPPPTLHHGPDGHSLMDLSGQTSSSSMVSKHNMMVNSMTTQAMSGGMMGSGQQHHQPIEPLTPEESDGSGGIAVQ